MHMSRETGIRPARIVTVFLSVVLCTDVLHQFKADYGQCGKSNRHVLGLKPVGLYTYYALRPVALDGDRNLKPIYGREKTTLKNEPIGDSEQQKGLNL